MTNSNNNKKTTKTTTKVYPQDLTSKNWILIFYISCNVRVVVIIGSEIRRSSRFPLAIVIVITSG